MQEDARPWLSPLLPAGTRAEASFETLATAITPNDEFFVRYHLAGIPQVDASTWTLSIGGEGADRAATLNLDALKKPPAFEVMPFVNARAIAAARSPII